MNVQWSIKCNLKSIGGTARLEQTAGRFRGVQRAISDRLRVHLERLHRSNLDAAGLYAGLAEKKRPLNSERTRAALAVKKASGGRLGYPINIREAGDSGRRWRKA